MAPAGNPAVVKLTEPLKPLLALIVMRDDVVHACQTVWVLGETEIEKSGD